jgi:hypothetical protein
MTKASEVLDELDTELRRLDAALIQIRSVTKSLEGARDTLKFCKNWLQHSSDVRESTDGR